MDIIQIPNKLQILDTTREYPNPSTVIDHILMKDSVGATKKLIIEKVDGDAVLTINDEISDPSAPSEIFMLENSATDIYQLTIANDVLMLTEYEGDTLPQKVTRAFLMSYTSSGVVEYYVIKLSTVIENGVARKALVVERTL